jgi:hypothetical protein
MSLVLGAACAAPKDNKEGPRAPPPVTGPSSVDDVVGIWRNVHQGVFEIRQDGSYVLISPITEPEAGTYTLQADRLELHGEKGCGAARGIYRVRVKRAQRMDLTADRDPCTSRLRVLVGDPWIYTPR